MVCFDVYVQSTLLALVVECWPSRRCGWVCVYVYVLPRTVCWGLTINFGAVWLVQSKASVTMRRSRVHGQTEKIIVLYFYQVLVIVHPAWIARFPPSFPSSSPKFIPRIVDGPIALPNTCTIPSDSKADGSADNFFVVLSSDVWNSDRIRRASTVPTSDGK